MKEEWQREREEMSGLIERYPNEKIVDDVIVSGYVPPLTNSLFAQMCRKSMHLKSYLPADLRASGKGWMM